jgi:peptidyl-prolyl cis-trans isomerase SurA
MQVGEISQPFAWTLDNGKTICAIAKLKSKVEAHRATLKDDYELLKYMYQAQLSEKRIQEWIKAKQKKTYVRINKNIKREDFKYPDWIFFEE